MNLGMNITLNLTLGSGTVAAATEGAFAGLPSIAFSLGIEGERFAEVSAARGRRDEEGDAITQAAAARCLELTQVILAREEREAVAREGAPRPCVVHNINLPSNVSATSEVRETTLASALMPPLFERLSPEESTVESVEGAFQLRFCFSKEWHHTHNPNNSDLRALQAGYISHCVLDWGGVSVPST
jgi:5'/3'-nucleotidase SurE